MMIVIKIILVVLLADLFTGIVHFILDQYGNPRRKLLRNAVLINLAHHSNPRKMVSRGYWYLTKDSYKIAIVLFLLSLFFGVHWEVILFLLLGANTNIIHKWAHQIEREKAWPVKILHKLRILQTRKHHGNHHRDPFESNFCIITNILNPILEYIRFWSILQLIFGWFGLQPVDRSDPIYKSFDL